MARHPRVIVPGIAVHLVQRGNNRAACFREESDYLVYLGHLRRLCALYQCEMHAYCLMTNHVHLLLTPNAATACGQLMRDLGRCYVRYFNDRHKRSGTLWEGRFRSCIVESAAYVLACYRYIELNPVRAGMVADPLAFPWSSHTHNAGVRTDPLIGPHAEFSALAERPYAVYRALVGQPLGDAVLRSIREATEGGYPLVSESFKQRVMLPLGLRTEPGKPGRTTTVQLRP